MPEPPSSRSRCRSSAELSEYQPGVAPMRGACGCCCVVAALCGSVGASHSSAAGEEGEEEEEEEEEVMVLLLLNSVDGSGSEAAASGAGADGAEVGFFFRFFLAAPPPPLFFARRGGRLVLRDKEPDGPPTVPTLREDKGAMKPRDPPSKNAEKTTIERIVTRMTSTKRYLGWAFLTNMIIHILVEDLYFFAS